MYKDGVQILGSGPTIAHAERIYVLEKGRIVETGTHSELLEQGGLYAALWREQSAA